MDENLEAIAKEKELSQEFIEEYKKLREKYQRDIIVEIRTEVVPVNIPTYGNSK